MNTKKIAEAVKEHLVALAIADKLPSDLTQLSISKLEKAIKSAIPTEREIMIDRASHLLSDGDISTEEMCDAIANHEDQYDLIDNVEGVVVWQKVEGRLYL